MKKVELLLSLIHIQMCIRDSCENCGKPYGTVEYGKICPYCGSEKTFLLQGNEFNIKEIEVEQDEKLCFLIFMERQPDGSFWAG